MQRYIENNRSIYYFSRS